jgi:hypothetical protein
MIMGLVLRLMLLRDLARFPSPPESLSTWEATTFR